MISTADRQFYADEIRLAIMRLNQHYGSACPTPVIRWRLTGTSRLGIALGAIEINLNTAYAEAMGRDRFRQVALHEACHIVTTWRRQKLGIPRPQKQPSNPWSGHGSEWKRAMRTLGLTPDRCSAVPMDVSLKVQTNGKVKVICNCQVHHFSTARFKQVLAGAKFRCKGCKSHVVPFRTLDDGTIERMPVQRA